MEANGVVGEKIEAAPRHPPSLPICKPIPRLEDDIQEEPRHHAWAPLLSPIPHGASRGSGPVVDQSNLMIGGGAFRCAACCHFLALLRQLKNGEMSIGDKICLNLSPTFKSCMRKILQVIDFTVI